MGLRHGRDNRLLVWKLGLEDEEGMSTVLPVQDEGLLAMHRRRPWLLHALPVNALNFCAFGDCAARGAELVSGGEADELLVAVPNAVRSEAVDIFHLPSERRLYTVAGDGSVNTGMVMAVSLFYRADDGLALVVGFESGHAMVTQMVPGKADEDKEERRWQMLYLSHAHTQPVLSLDLAPDRAHFLTSSADALLAKHPIPARPPGPAGARDLPSTPLKVVRTGHAGQQSLQLRSDGAIFATAGWDARVRVYSARSLRELAVLRWHKTGCYAVAFARVGHGHAGHAGHGEEGDGGGDAGDAGDGGGDGTTISTAPAAPGARALIPKLTTLSVKEARIQKVTTAHWLVAGSKDGKVSLWDIY
ncbi:MAG: ASTRA complex subunit [Claussenomyces sp. TS43310]|nr:MAG: ASTRA complex subunit [Claussenomyces sp. TS43310]